MLQRN